MSDQILAILKARSCITGSDLIMAMMSLVGPIMFNKEEFARVLMGMIARGDIVELRYEDPNFPLKTFSLFFKKGTKFLNDNTSKAILA